MINYWDDKYGGKEEEINNQRLKEKLNKERYEQSKSSSESFKTLAIKFCGIFVKDTNVKIYGRDIYEKFIEITMSKTDFETMVKESNIKGDNND